jgi:hypothetical protein
MTLIIAALSPEVSCLAFDHLVSNESGPDEERAGLKAFSVGMMGDQMYIAFTGAARGAGFNTREWLIAQIDGDNYSSVRLIVETWRKRSSDLLALVPEEHRRLSVFVLARESGRIVVYLLSNFERMNGQPVAQPKPANTLSTTREEVTEPRFLTFGARTALLTTDGSTLLKVLSDGLPQIEAGPVFADVIARASQHPNGRGVGAGCFVDWLPASGQTGSISYGGTPGAPDMIMNGINIGKWARNHLLGLGGERALFKGEKHDPSPLEAYAPKPKGPKK